MTRRRPALPRWFGSAGRPGTLPPASLGRPPGVGRADGPGRAEGTEVPTADTEPPGTHRVGDTVLLSDPAAGEEHTAALRALAARVEPVPAMPTLLVAVPDTAADALWPALGAQLRRLTGAGDEGEDGDTGDECGGADVVRLVMSAAAATAPDDPHRPSLAQQLADAWRISVVAPDAAAVVTPGGTLFVPAPATPGGGWWRCDPDRPPTALGQRHPAPDWQPALARVGTREFGDSIAEQIPAGLLLRPRRAPAPEPGDLALAVPADPGRPTLLVGSPTHPPVPAQDIAALLTSLPVASRSALRLAPGDHRDLLASARAVADLLDGTVEVLTGPPLITARRTQVLVSGPDASLAWRPFVASVTCRPVREDGSRPAEEPMAWYTPPVHGSRPAGDTRLDLGDGWQLDLTRWGLRFGTADAAVPRPQPRHRSVDPAAPVLVISGAGAGAGSCQDPTFWPALTDVLDALEPGFRERTVLAVEGPLDDRDRHALSRLAASRRLTLVTEAAPTPAPGPGERSPVPPGREAGRPLPLLTASAATTPGPRIPLQLPAQTPAPAPVPMPPAPAPAPNPAPNPAPAPASAPTPAPAPASAPVPVSAPAPNPAPAPPPAPASLQAPAANPAPGLVSGPGRADGAEVRIVPAVRCGGVPLSEALATPQLRVQGEQVAAAAPTAAPTALPVTSSAPAPEAAPVAVRAHAPLPPTATAAEPVAVPECTDLHRSTFREAMGAHWERHAGAVSRAMIQMPALRTRDEEAARAELAAAHLYLSPGGDAPFAAAVLRAGPESDDPAVLAYRACLFAGLRRLPVFRGPVLRAWEPDTDPAADQEPGGWILVQEPVSALPSAAAHRLLPAQAGRYAVRTASGRRTGPLLGTADGGAGQPERIVLLPGTRLHVCATHPATDELPGRVLLNEAPPGATGSGRGLPTAEALARLEDAARSGTGVPPSTAAWLQQCTGPLGSYLPAGPAAVPVSVSSLESRSTS